MQNVNVGNIGKIGGGGGVNNRRRSSSALNAIVHPFPSLVTSLFVILGLTCFLGCGSRDRITSVTGIITLDDSPIDNAVVTFIPVGSEGKHAVATAKTDKNGKYVLATHFGDKTIAGAFPGHYVVTVIKRIQTNRPESDFENLTPEKEAELMNQISAELKGRSATYRYIIPKKYESQGTSELTADVPSSGKIVCDFPLKNAPLSP